jgi:hypothetical protein
MLQMIPQVSARRAQLLVDNPRFSSVKATFDELNGNISEQQQSASFPGSQEREYMLANCFQDNTGTTSADRGAAASNVKLRKLSSQVYRSIHADTNPDATIA